MGNTANQTSLNIPRSDAFWNKYPPLLSLERSCAWRGAGTYAKRTVWAGVRCGPFIARVKGT